MTWITLSLLVGLLWAIGNITEKFILTKECKDPLIATFLFGIVYFVVYSFIPLLKVNILIPNNLIFWSIITGFIYSIAVYLYFWTMQKLEVTRYITILTTVPIYISIFAST